jgi:hypothetical protein
MVEEASHVKQLALKKVCKKGLSTFGENDKKNLAYLESRKFTLVG